MQSARYFEGETELVERNPSVGVVFDDRRFEKPSSGGCARGWQIAGWDDFPHGSFKLEVGRGVQCAHIDEKATSFGEAGIERYIEANPGEIYRLTARVRLKEKTGRFSARIGLVARSEHGLFIKNFDTIHNEISNEPVWLSVEATVPQRSTLLSPEFKVQTSEPGESGTAEVYSMRLERVR